MADPSASVLELARDLLFGGASVREMQSSLTDFFLKFIQPSRAIAFPTEGKSPSLWMVRGLIR